MATRGLVTMTEAAQICGFSRQRLYQLLQAGKFLPVSLKVGNTNVWDENEVRQWSDKYAETANFDRRHFYGERTKTILRLTAEGLKTCEIAKILGTSTNVVGGYLYRLKKVFKAKNNTELVKMAVKEKVI